MFLPQSSSNWRRPGYSGFGLLFVRSSFLVVAVKLFCFLKRTCLFRHVHVREQIENLSAKQNQVKQRDSSLETQRTAHAKTQDNRKTAQQHRVTEQQSSSPAVQQSSSPAVQQSSSPAVQQSTPTAKMAETPAALNFVARAVLRQSAPSPYRG